MSPQQTNAQFLQAGCPSYQNWGKNELQKLLDLNDTVNIVWKSVLMRCFGYMLQLADSLAVAFMLTKLLNRFIHIFISKVATTQKHRCMHYSNVEVPSKIQFEKTLSVKTLSIFNHFKNISGAPKCQKWSRKFITCSQSDIQNSECIHLKVTEGFPSFKIRSHFYANFRG